MSCDLQKHRKEYIEKDIPQKQFDFQDDNYSVDFIDYEDIIQNGLETADQSISVDNFNDFSVDTHEKFVFIYAPQLKKPQIFTNQRNIPIESQENKFVHTFPKINTKSFRRKLEFHVLICIQDKLSFEKEGLLLYQKQYVYCKVEHKQLNIYTSKESKEIILTIRFDIFPSQAQLVYNAHGQAQFIRLKLLTQKPLEYTFYHDDSIELQNWFKDMNYQILASEPYLKLIPEFELIPSYQKRIHITEDDFLQEADSLDLVFFLGKSFGSRITRIVSQSDYDHVALVLRGSKDQIFFFEAGQNHGVSLYTWEKFKNYNWRDFYKQIVFRKLHCTRTNEMIETLEKFVKSAAGKSYELSISKLFKKKSVISQIEAEEGRTYFCSELIASAYKRMGLLPADVSSAQYWPRNFSEQGRINLLLENSYLSQEKVIYA